MLPPFNYQHDMVDDVNIPEDSNSLGPDVRATDNITTSHIVASYDLIAERIVEDTPALVGGSSVRWVTEEKEDRFDTNLLEEQFLQTQVGDEWDARWQWINIQTMPWDFTEFSLPALLDKPTETGYDSGDYLLVSSFLTEDSADTEHGSGAVRLKFAYDADGSFSDIYVNNVCQKTLRVYGESDQDAPFPYTSDNYTGPFALTNAEAPKKDFVQFNPAAMRHDDPDSLGQFREYFGNAIQAGGDANEKVHLRMWYTPHYPAPRGLTYPEVDDPVYNPDGDIVLEYTYVLLEPDTFDPQTGPPGATRLVFPLAGSEGQHGLDRMDVNGDQKPETLSIDEIVGVVTGTLGTHRVITLTDGITDNLRTTRGIIQVSPQEAQAPIYVAAGEQVQFLDYMAELEGVSLFGEWADVSLWYAGNSTRSLLGTVRLELNTTALVGRFWGPAAAKFGDATQAEAAAEAAMVTTGLPARPFWVTLDSIVEINGVVHARLTPHRLLMTGETLFVDCVEYDVAAILVQDANLDAGEVDAEIQYITLRNPLPKGAGELDISPLTVYKCKIPASTNLWMLPPLNYEHDVVDDVNVPEDWNTLGPDAQEADNITTNHIVSGYDLIEERIVEDTPALDGDPFIGWVTEAKEGRFDTNLLEETYTQTVSSHMYGPQTDGIQGINWLWEESWQWINVETMPWDYTELRLPELPGQPAADDYLLVSSFLTQDSITTTHGAGAVRLKFAYDPANGTGIYVDPRPGSQEGFFQGRVKLESAAYQELALDVQVIAQGGVVAGTTAHTDPSGYFTLALDPGVYDVWVKEAHALAKRMDDIVIAAGATTACSFGALLVGDANDDNLVDIRDFGVWKDTLLSTTDLRADFNLDGQVTSLDFGWIKWNFIEQGDDPLTGQASAVCGGAATSSLPGLSPAGTVTVYLDPATSSVSSGEVFTLAIKVAAGGEAVDSADVFVDFDPTYLEVVSVSGSGVLDESGKAWDNDLGEVFYGVADLNKTASATFTLATITFRATAASSGTPVTFHAASPRKTTVNSGVTPLPLVTQPATVKIGGLIVRIAPPASSVCVGKTFTLTVQIEAGAQELDGAQAFVDFDPTYITVTNLSNGGALPVELYTSYDNALGHADFAAGAAISTTVSGTLSLANIAFRAVTVTGEAPTQLFFHTIPPRETLVILGETTLSNTLEGGMVRIGCFSWLPIIHKTSFYTVSGRVMEGDGSPVPGVTVSRGAGRTTATGSDGSYTLDGLLAGTYSIVPSKNGYTFAPPSHVVSVPPTAVGQNFVATPPTPTSTPTSTPTPTPTPTPTGASIPTSTPFAGATPTHTPSPTPRPCTEVVANGSFETDGYWELPITAYPAAYTSAAAHYGYRAMRVGILNPADNRYSYSSARQLVTIPANAASATLRFWLYPVSGEPPANLSLPARLLTLMTQDATLYGDAQYVDLLDQNDQWLTELLWQRRNDQVWMYHQFDLMAYAGQTIKLYFGAYNDGAGGVTGMYVDDVSLEVCTYP